MSNETQAPKGEKLSGGAKLAVDMGPLVVFMVAYFFGSRLVSLAGTLSGHEWCMHTGAEMYLAVAAFLPSFAIAFAYSYWKERRIAPMLLVTGVIVGVLGSLTLILHNKTFFYMKPTIVYALFSSVLAAGLFTGRNFLKIVFDGALHMPDDAWKTLTRRYAIFFAVLAVANEIAWRWLTKDCPAEILPTASVYGEWSWLLAGCDGTPVAKCAGEADWVRLKVFGFTLVSLIFTGFQAPFIAKHMPEEEKPSDN
ncbi:inner membrane-spanning protein YciB [Hyphococcus sp.]|uniref:inner membrane-spanning protein YciB n=1 Tax=Hyphococcus sp. TaxID=2038636 RepID=UPI002082CFE5|nr:MAG: putative intracellular septation protein A [Marinicaulis sp.]